MTSTFETIEWIEPVPTVAELHKRGILHSAVYRSRVRELEQRLVGLQPVKELHATQLVSFLDGMAEAAFVRLICAHAGVGYQPTLRVISGGEFRRDTRGNDLREIDLVIVDTDAPDRRKPVVAIEAKFDATVHGDFGYCGVAEHARYSNQIICYPHGCVHPNLTAQDVRFVWLGLEVHRARPMSRFKGAITDRDRETKFPNERALQDHAEAIWVRVTWEEAWKEVSAAVTDQVLSDALLRGLGRP